MKITIAILASLFLVIRHLLTILKSKTFRVTMPLEERGGEYAYLTWQVVDEDTGQWRDVTEHEMRLIQGFKGIDLR